MPDQVQLRGGTAADNDAFTGVNREVTVDTTNKTLRVHDGTTSGGSKLAAYDAWGRLQVADPVDATDATSKSYVDGAIEDSVAFKSITEVTVASATGSIVFSSIPGTYRSLLLQVVGRSTAPSGTPGAAVRFNGDTTGENYDWQFIQGSGSTANAGSGSGQTFGRIGNFPNDAEDVGIASSINVTIPDYAGTFHKAWQSTAWLRGGGGLFSQLFTGAWRNTDPITEITVFCDGFDLTSARATLYGLEVPS